MLTCYARIESIAMFADSLGLSQSRTILAIQLLLDLVQTFLGLVLVLVCQGCILRSFFEILLSLFELLLEIVDLGLFRLLFVLREALDFIVNRADLRFKIRDDLRERLLLIKQLKDTV